MRLLTANKILLTAAAVVVPVSVYFGLDLKERNLAAAISRIPDSSQLKTDRAMRARIVQLEQERQELLKEGEEVDQKVLELKLRLQRAADLKG